MPSVYDTRDAGPVVTPTAADFAAEARRHTLEALWAKLNHDEAWVRSSAEAQRALGLVWWLEHRNGKRRKGKR